MTLGPRLPDYKKCIERLIEMGPDSDDDSNVFDGSVKDSRSLDDVAKNNNEDSD